MMELAASNGIARLTVLLLVFGMVVIGAFVVMAFLSRRAVVRSELVDLVGATGGGQRSVSLRETANNTAWAKLADTIERAGLNLTDTKSDRIRQRLIQAGYTSPAAPRIYTMVRLGLVFVLPLGYVLLSFSGGSEPPSFLQLYMWGSGLALLGLYLPNLLVQVKADRRREAIVNGFPDCLDLILVCVEAGLGVEAAMDRVGRETVTSHPLVAELLSVTTLQLRAGATREEAFRKLAETASVDEIRSFTTLLIQSDKLGTSISTTLRVYASEMRERRRMRAEEKAHRLPVLISIPLVACMLPTMIGVIMLPASIKMINSVFPMMAG